MGTMAKKKPRPRSAPNPWPDRLRDLRRIYGTRGVAITQEEAAERINCPVATWRGWEQGRRKPNPMIVRLLELQFPRAFAKKS
jgi:DNA-binding transcriptional regulator YiaG